MLERQLRKAELTTTRDLSEMVLARPHALSPESLEAFLSSRPSVLEYGKEWMEAQKKKLEVEEK